MNEKNSNLTKICSYCGQIKPLAAFLEFSSEKGSYYGSVCSTCRKTVIEEKRKKREAEEATTSSSGFKIDAKTKVQKESDKRKLRKEQTEQDIEEKGKKDNLNVKVQSKKQTISQEEKKLRSFLEKRNYPADSAKSEKSFGSADAATVTAKEKEINLAVGPVLDTQIAGKVKFQSSVFNQFKSWLGGAAPIVSAAEKAKENNMAKPDAVTDFVKKQGPKSR